MVKKRVFLFGAGAAYEWGGPSTSELTKLVLESGYYTMDSKTTITRYIYETLLSKGYSETNLNFETIIAVIEEMIVYYSKFNSLLLNSPPLPSINQCFFEPTFDNIIFNYSIKGGQPIHGYQLQIPKNEDYYLSKNAYHQEHPHQFFLEHLLAKILSSISERITRYSYHSRNSSEIDFESEASKSFVDWIKLHNKQTRIRMYTLNYDRIFKVLLQRNGIDVFEGFDAGEYLEADDTIPNVGQILSDYDCNVHYNLHGSAYWGVNTFAHHLLPNPEIVLKNYPELTLNNQPARIQVEKGKNVIVTNIVTGYQKAQKAMISPFKQMQSTFDRDCHTADEIYVVGYSFGDEHINSSLRTAVRSYIKRKLIIVDPGFMKNRLDEEVSIKMFSKLKTPPCTKTLDKNVHEYHGGSIEVYTMGFKEFRGWQLNNLDKNRERV